MKWRRRNAPLPALEVERKKPGKKPLQKPGIVKYFSNFRKRLCHMLFFKNEGLVSLTGKLGLMLFSFLTLWCDLKWMIITK